MRASCRSTRLGVHYVPSPTQWRRATRRHFHRWQGCPQPGSRKVHRHVGVRGGSRNCTRHRCRSPPAHPLQPPQSVNPLPYLVRSRPNASTASSVCRIQSTSSTGSATERTRGCQEGEMAQRQTNTRGRQLPNQGVVPRPLRPRPPILTSTSRRSCAGLVPPRFTSMPTYKPGCDTNCQTQQPQTRKSTHHPPA